MDVRCLEREREREKIERKKERVPLATPPLAPSRNVA